MIARHGLRLSNALRFYLCQNGSDWCSVDGNMSFRQSHTLENAGGKAALRERDE